MFDSAVLVRDHLERATHRAGLERLQRKLLAGGGESLDGIDNDRFSPLTLVCADRHIVRDGSLKSATSSHTRHLYDSVVRTVYLL